jgi:agmatine deiminase
MPERVIEHLGMRRYSAGPFICEGGGISVDGEGTLITTEQVMMNPNRYSGSSRQDVERSLHDWLGIEKVIWLGKRLAEDIGTDGHVDNIVEYVAPGVVIAQTVRDESNPNFALLQDDLQRLRSATDARGRQLEIIEMDVLPYQEAPDGKRYVVPYTNAYVVNGAVIAPAVEAADDERGFRILEQAFPGREIVPVPSIAQAVGGGGVGCITQQVPEGPA